jgi:hypothetical protein
MMKEDKLKQPGREAERSIPTSVDVKKTCMPASGLHYAFTA